MKSGCVSTAPSFTSSHAKRWDNFLPEVPDSVTNTQLVAEMCDLTIPFPKGNERYPKYPLPPEVKTDRAGYLRELCVTGLKNRYGFDFESVAARPVVAARLAKLTNLPAGQKPQAPEYAGLAPEEELAVRMGFELAIINITASSTTSSSSGISSRGRRVMGFPSALAAARAPVASSRICWALPISIRSDSSSSSNAS